jgi:hypothetical protein
MTSAATYDATAATAARFDDTAYSQLLQEGDTVRCGEDRDECKVIGTWSDWLWLLSLHPRNLAPFTARAGACKLLRRAEPPKWPYR